MNVISTASTWRTGQKGSVAIVIAPPIMRAESTGRRRLPVADGAEMPSRALSAPSSKLWSREEADAGSDAEQSDRHAGRFWVMGRHQRVGGGMKQRAENAGENAVNHQHFVTAGHAH